MNRAEARRVARALHKGVASTNLPPAAQQQLLAALSTQSAMEVVVRAVIESNAERVAASG